MHFVSFQREPQDLMRADHAAVIVAIKTRDPEASGRTMIAYLNTCWEVPKVRSCLAADDGRGFPATGPRREGRSLSAFSTEDVRAPGTLGSL